MTAIADRILEIVCVASILFSLFLVLTFGHGRDQGIYAVVARSIVEGRMPYRDAWDFKPPGVFLIYALARVIFGSSQAGIRILEAAGILAMAVTMVRLTEKLWGDYRIGLIAGAIAAVIHAQLDFWHTGQPESFGGFLTIFALAVLAPLLREGSPARLGMPLDRSAMWRLVAAGCLFGATGLLKPPLAGGAAILALAFALPWILGRPISLGNLTGAAIPGALLAVGGCLPILACLGWFASRGALRELVDVLFVFTPHYTALSWVGVNPLWLTYEGFIEWVFEYSSLGSVGVILAFALQPTRRERFGFQVILGIIAVQVAGVILQAKFFPYHFGATWPLTALVAAIGFVRLWELVGSRGPVRMVVFFAAVGVSVYLRQATKDLRESFFKRAEMRVALFSAPYRDQQAIDAMASVADVNSAANRDVALFLQARVPRSRSVFVWGFEPVIYDLSERAAATRYIYNVPQRVTWSHGVHRRVLMEDLERSRPAAIVVERHDVFPMVTGSALDSHDTLVDFWELRDLIESRYVRATTIEDFDVYLEQSE